MEALQQNEDESSELSELDETVANVPASSMPGSPFVEIPTHFAPPGTNFPLIASTPNGKHAHIVHKPSELAVTISSDEDEQVFVKPARPVKGPARRSTRSSTRESTATQPPCIAKPPKARKSPALQLAEEGDEDLSIVMLSESKGKKKMKLRTKASPPRGAGSLPRGRVFRCTNR